jgi:N-carbamoylputrescine amidase
MPRKVTVGLIQTHNPVSDPKASLAKVQKAALDLHLKLLHEAGKKGVQILGLQEIFNGPYFCPSQDAKWYDAAEPVPGLGKYRKNHIPHTSGFWEKYFFKPGNMGYPVFQTRFAKVGVYICYDRHFPEGARALGLNGAEIVFNPSATVAGLSQYLWKLEQPAHAVANGYFVAASNRVGTEAPWNIGRFYGTSYIVDPRGNFLATGSEDKDELVVATCDLDLIEEVRRTWQFFRDRRPETYDTLVAL